MYSTASLTAVHQVVINQRNGQRRRKQRQRCMAAAAVQAGRPAKGRRAGSGGGEIDHGRSTEGLYKSCLIITVFSEYVSQNF